MGEQTQPPPNAAPATSEALPRSIGMWTMVAVTMGVVIGSGVFRTPSSIAQLTGSVSELAIIWTAGGLATLCLALCLAELAAMYPRAGGIYVYLYEAYGPALAFVFGWTFLLINPAQWAALALIFSEYLGAFASLTPTGKRAAASALIASVCAANYYSLRFAAAIHNVSTASKALALVVISLLLFTLGEPSAGAFAQPIEWTLPSFSVFGAAIIAVLWPYEGVASACALAGEVRNPSRNLPRALLLSVVGVTVLYLLVNAAYLYVLPVDAIAASGFVAAQAMQAVAGSAGAAFISGCVLLSTFGAIAATATLDPRVFYAMAHDGLFFKRIGAIHPRRRTPHIAILVSGALAIAYLWIRTFEELAAQFIIGLWLFYALAAAGLLVLRIRKPELSRPYRVAGYPAVPVVFVLCAAALLAGALLELPGVTLVNFGVTLAGVPFYFIWRWRSVKP